MKILIAAAFGVFVMRNHGLVEMVLTALVVDLFLESVL